MIRRRRNRTRRREIKLLPIGYQSSKTELKGNVRLPATPSEIARVVFQYASITRAD